MRTPAETPAELPDDIEALKALVHKQADDKRQLRDQIASLQEQLNLLLQKRFGPSSEKIPPDQLRLFNEAEAEGQSAEAEEERVIVPEHERKQRGRKPLPASLPRVRIEHDLTEMEKTAAAVAS